MATTDLRVLSMIAARARGWSLLPAAVSRAMFRRTRTRRVLARQHRQRLAEVPGRQAPRIRQRQDLGYLGEPPSRRPIRAAGGKDGQVVRGNAAGRSPRAPTLPPAPYRVSRSRVPSRRPGVATRFISSSTASGTSPGPVLQGFPTAPKRWESSPPSSISTARRSSLMCWARVSDPACTAAVLKAGVRRAASYTCRSAGPKFRHMNAPDRDAGRQPRVRPWEAA